MKIFLDLDGVLVDFVGGICAWHERPNPYQQGISAEYAIEDIWGMPRTHFWEPCSDPQFWANLEWTEDGQDILHEVLEFADTSDICLLTSPTLDPEAAKGKMLWIQHHLAMFTRQFLIGPPKHFCAHPGAILIDDSDTNIATFVEHGGHGITVPRPWNNHYDKTDVIGHVRAQIYRALTR